MDKKDLYIPKMQPDILGNNDSFGNIDWTYKEIIDNLYEPLVKKYPNYIKRVFLGHDTSLKYEMYAYEFAPENYEKTIYIQSGVHPIETEGYFSLARIMHLIAEDDAMPFSSLRNNIRFLIVPCVSVFGVSIKGTRDNIMSGKRYEIKHNELSINANRDYFDEKLKETQNVRKYVEKYKDEIDFAFDFHTTTDKAWNAYLLPYPDNLPKDIAEDFKSINTLLYEINKPSCPISYMGDEEHYPTGPLKGSFIGGFYKDYGILGCVIEHSDYIFCEKLGEKEAMTRAVELYLNFVLYASKNKRSEK